MNPEPGYPFEGDGLPCEIEAEQMVLGAMLMSSEWAIEQAAETLEPADFYEPAHAEIYRVILAKFNRGENVSPVTVKPHVSWLDGEDYRHLEGTKYLAKLCGAAGGTSSIKGYVQTVSDTATRRKVIVVCREMIGAAIDAEVDVSPSDIVSALETDLTKLVTVSERKEPVSIASVADGLTRQAEGVLDGTIKPKGILTGLRAFDSANGPLKPTDLVIVGGAPSMGKTALCQQVTFNAAKAFAVDEAGDRIAGARVLSISSEMSGEQYTARHLSQLADVDSERIEMGSLTAEEIERVRLAAERMRHLPLWIEDARGLTVERIRSIARRAKRKNGLDLLLIDHLGFIAKPEKRMNIQEAIETNVYLLKNLAKELYIPILCISHLNRQIWSRDDKRPQLSDLHGASAIEKDADAVCFVHREEYYLDRNKPQDMDSDEYLEWGQLMEKFRGKAEIINAKRRMGKAGQTFTCLFDGARTTFSNLSEAA